MSKIPVCALAILKCGEEILFIIRQNHLRVFPGYCSFPGGKVDRKELDLIHNDLPPKLLGTAARELMEELGFDLKAELEKAQTKITHIGQAITPDFNPYQFEAQYFLVELDQKPQFSLCDGEIKEAFWATPDSMEMRYQSGELLVIPPMWKILDCIRNGERQHLSFNVDTQPSEVPCLESIYGVKQFMPLSNTLPPADRTNAFSIGDILVDPSPRDEDELEKLIHSLREIAVTKIFITHHHGDHHQFCGQLARRLGCDIYMSSYTKMRLNEMPSNSLEGIEPKIAIGGDAMGEWLGRKVLVHEIPGHDEGQLALAPEDLSWFIAGDLFQGVGTVVVGGREGDMKKYFETLEKVIQMEPKALYPSHGIVLGGTAILEKTLAHRKLREEQVRKLYLSGLSAEQMLQKIYFDIPQSLYQYALANIQSHLEKILKEDS